MTAPEATQAALAARRHWRVSLGATACVLLLSALVSFVPPMLAYRRHPVAPAVTIAGTPWPYFIGAQGAVVMFVLLVVGYTIVMSRADRRYREALQRMGEASSVDGVDIATDANAPTHRCAFRDGGRVR